MQDAIFNVLLRLPHADRIPRMPTILDDEALLAIKALEHYDAYLRAARREDGTYRDLPERLKRKSVELEVTNIEKRKKA